MTDTPPAPVAFVLGERGGIGSALSRGLFSCGWRLELAAHGRERLKTLGNELRAHLEPADATVSEFFKTHFGLMKHNGSASLLRLRSDLLMTPKLTHAEAWARIAVAEDELLGRELNSLVAYRWSNTGSATATAALAR